MHLQPYGHYQPPLVLHSLVAPPLSHCDRDAARPPQLNIRADDVRGLCDAGGGDIFMVVKIYNFCNY